MPKINIFEWRTAILLATPIWAVLYAASLLTSGEVFGFLQVAPAPFASTLSLASVFVLIGASAMDVRDRKTAARVKLEGLLHTMPSLRNGSEGAADAVPWDAAVARGGEPHNVPRRTVFAFTIGSFGLVAGAFVVVAPPAPLGHLGFVLPLIMLAYLWAFQPLNELHNYRNALRDLLTTAADIRAGNPSIAAKAAEAAARDLVTREPSGAQREGRAEA